MKLPSLRNFTLTLAILGLFACQEKINKKPVESEEDKAEILLKSKEKAESIKTIFYSLPSPLELTILFKKEGVEYHYDKLHNTLERDKYITTVKKGLNLGIYGADLSYAGLFAKHSDAIQYFSVSQLLASDLGYYRFLFRERFLFKRSKPTKYIYLCASRRLDRRSLPWYSYDKRKDKCRGY